MEIKTKWKEAQDFESKWWGDCSNTFSEETKQLTYAKKMGLVADMIDGKYPVYDLDNKSVLDIGGGPVSILLKCINRGKCFVFDPCNFPDWISDRYKLSNILLNKTKGELIDLLPQIKQFDEVWIYNVLQHVDNPQKIIENAKKLGKIIRIFEWIDMPPVEGHPQELKEKLLNEWLGGEGKVEELNENYCHGRAYYGIFRGDNYEL